jgi:serine/threonine protein phosphatase PrpC
MSHLDSTGLLVGNQAHIGRISSDAHAIAVFPPVTDSQHSTTLAVVADGQMGYPFSTVNKVAAEIVVSSFVEIFGHAIPSNTRKLFTQAIETASGRLFRYREAYPEVESMLAMCAAAVIISDKLHTVNVGNCRIYLLRDRRLKQISTDHTFLQALVEAGQITRQDPRGMLGVDGMPLTRCLGMQPNYPDSELPDFRLRLDSAESDEQSEANQGLPLQVDDEILLCTGGMFGGSRYFPFVEDEQIQEALLSYEHPQQAAEALIALAHKMTESDAGDVTVIVLKFVGHRNRIT